MTYRPNKTVFLAFTLNKAAIADYYRALVEELVHRGYQVVIITDGKRIQKVSENSNPAIFTWPSTRPTRFVDAYFFFKLIRRWRPVMSFSNFGADNINLIVSWLLGVRLRFVSYHTMLDPDIFKKPISPSNQWKIMRKRFVYGLATMILPVAEAMRSDLSVIFHVPLDRIKVFHNAVSAHPELIQQQLKTQPDLVSAGALSKGKGHDVLIKAILQVVKTNSDVRLTIYGEGPERTRLESLIQSHGLTDVVKLPGNIHHFDIIYNLSKSFALIHPSRFEAFGYSIIEAFCVGTPVIASAVGGIPEIIRDGLDGFLVPPDDPNQLAERISQLCSDPGLRQEMSRNCLNHFTEAFELENAINKLANWLDLKIDQAL